MIKVSIAFLKHQNISTFFKGSDGYFIDLSMFPEKSTSLTKKYCIVSPLRQQYHIYQKLKTICLALANVEQAVADMPRFTVLCSFMGNHDTFSIECEC